MRLADTRRPQQQHRVGIGNKAPGRELANLLFVDRRLGVKVETIEIAHKRDDLPPEKWTPGYADFASARSGVM